MADGYSLRGRSECEGKGVDPGSVKRVAALGVAEDADAGADSYFFFSRGSMVSGRHTRVFPNIILSKI